MNRQTLLTEKEQLQKRLQEIEVELAKPEFDAQEFLQGIFNNYVSKTDRKKYPNVRFFGFDHEGNYLFEYDEKNNYFWVSYSKIWSVLAENNIGDYNNVQSVIKEVVEEHFKLKDVTPSDDDLFNLRNMVEEQFKLKDVTPKKPMASSCWRVEEHFKLKDVTPGARSV